MIDITFLNKNFRFVYTAKALGSRRFLVGAGALAKYIGSVNAQTVQKAAINSKTDKHTCKFRKCGKIEIYVK